MTETQKFKFQTYKLQKYRNTQITVTDIQMQKDRNENYRIREIQVKQKFTHNPKDTNN